MQIEKSNNKIEVGDVVEYTKHTSMVVKLYADDKFKYGIISLQTGTLLNSFKNLEDVNNNEMITLLCKNKNAKLFI